MVRFWLHDLASEYAAGSKHESLPPALSLDRVWITNDNQFQDPRINAACAARFCDAALQHDTYGAVGV